MKLSELKPGQAFLYFGSLFLVCRASRFVVLPHEDESKIAALRVMTAEGEHLWEITSFVDEEMDDEEYTLLEDV